MAVIGANQMKTVAFLNHLAGLVVFDKRVVAMADNCKITALTMERRKFSSEGLSRAVKLQEDAQLKKNVGRRNSECRGCLTLGVIVQLLIRADSLRFPSQCSRVFRSISTLLSPDSSSTVSHRMR